MDNYSILIPQESQYQAVLEFLVEDFLQRERCCVASGLSADIKEKGLANDPSELLMVMEKNISFVAVDERDKSIAGLCINITVEDSDKLGQYFSSLPRKRQVIAKFAADLEVGYRPSAFNNTPSKGLHLWMLGVREIHSGVGLARKLTEKTIELAQQQGFNHVESLATSSVTRHLFGSMGFEAKSKMKLQDFVMADDNSPGFPFATPEDLAEFSIKIL